MYYYYYYYYIVLLHTFVLLLYIIIFVESANFLPRTFNLNNYLEIVDQSLAACLVGYE